MHRLTAVVNRTSLQYFIDKKPAALHKLPATVMDGWQTIFSIGNLVATPVIESSCVPRQSCPAACSELGPQVTRCARESDCISFGECTPDPCADGLGVDLVTCTQLNYSASSQPWGGLQGMRVFSDALSYDQVQLLGLNDSANMRWSTTMSVTVPPVSLACVPIVHTSSVNSSVPPSSWYWDSALRCSGTADVVSVVVGNPAISHGPRNGGDHSLSFGNDDVMLLRPALQLGYGWTVDMWIHVPIPALQVGNSRDESSTLFSDAKGGRLFIAKTGKVSIESGSTVVASNVDIAALAAGWHRLTVVVGDKWSIFYLDSEAADVVNAAVDSAVHSIGNDALVMTPECRLVPMGISDGRITAGQIYGWDSIAKRYDNSTGQCGTRQYETMEDFVIFQSQPQCSIEAARLYSPTAGCGWCPQIDDFNSQNAQAISIEIDLETVTSVGGVSTTGSPTMHTTYVTAGMGIRLRMPGTDLFIGRPHGEDTNTRWLAKGERSVAARNRTYMHLFTAQNYDNGCFLGAACWSNRASDQTQLQAGDVVVWYFPEFDDLLDCAGYTCGSAPYPVQDDQWGSPFKIYKSDGSSGRIKVGDTVYFQRLGRNLDENWCDTCFVDCSFEKCGGTQTSERDDFQICMTPDGTTRDPCGGAFGSTEPMDGGADDIGQWVTSYSIEY
eukprot:COSAG02_NODE_6448_length_3563_cov_3.024850_1_plen_668_part_10